MKAFLFKSIYPLSLMPLALAVLGLIQQQGRLFWSALIICLWLWVIAWLLSEPQKKEKSKNLPSASVKELRRSLHHSQVTLFNELIEPLMEHYFAKDKKMANNPGYFQEKCELWKKAFSELKASRVLYINRGSVNKDKALTLFAFLAVLFSDKKDIDSLVSELSRLPDFAYKALKNEAYRLFDLPCFILKGELLCNQREASLFHKLRSDNPIAVCASFQEDAKSLEESLSFDVLQPRIVNEEKTALPDNKIMHQEEAEIKAKPGELVEEDGPSHSVLEDFIAWLEKRIQSNNRKFDPENQDLIKTSRDFKEDMVFVEAEILAKYQSRSGIAIERLESALNQAFEGACVCNSSDDEIPVFPVKLSESLDIKSNSLIYKRSQ